MKADAMNMSQAELDRLACPACLGSLQLQPALVACLQCGRLYPIVDSLPVLIVSRATQRKPAPQDA